MWLAIMKSRLASAKGSRAASDITWGLMKVASSGLFTPEGVNVVAIDVPDCCPGRDGERTPEGSDLDASALQVFGEKLVFGPAEYGAFSHR